MHLIRRRQPEKYGIVARLQTSPVVDLDDIALEGSLTPRTKAQFDTEVSELPFDRRLSMTARRAADLFEYVSMHWTASLLRELARAADLEVSAASAVMEAETE